MHERRIKKYQKGDNKGGPLLVERMTDNRIMGEIS